MRIVPAARATLIVAALLPIVALAARALVRRCGVELSAMPFALGVMLPIAGSAALTAVAFLYQLSRPALALRDAMREFAARDFTAPPPPAPRSGDRDLLGIVDTWERMRRELDAAIRRLAHADAQRRRLFADLAHELATPASTLLGLGDTLAQADEPGISAMRPRLVGLIQAETLRLARLVEDVRDLAELDDPDVSFLRERLSLTEVVVATVDRFSGLPGAPVRIEAGAVDAEIDSVRIDQAVTNLLTNARRHTPAKGQILVSVALVHGEAVVRVEDSGCGVSADALLRLGERLFRPDASRDRANGGHGLGLSIVASIMARHDGSLTFESSSLGGLAVTMKLPAAP